MERIKVMVNGKELSLVTDDSPELIKRVAAKLEEKIIEFGAFKIRSNEEMLTLVALNILSEAENDMTGIKNVISEQQKKINLLEDEIAIFKDSAHQTLTENIKSATSELEQIARVKDEKNESLMHKIAEYEGYIEHMVRDREIEIKRLNEGFDSAIKEIEHIAHNKDTQNNTLRNTLNTYEATFDNYVKLKEEEITKLRGLLEDAKAECELMKTRLASHKEGQLGLGYV